MFMGDQEREREELPQSPGPPNSKIVDPYCEHSVTHDSIL